MIRLAVFDLETTGTNVEVDRIVSAAIAILEPDGTVYRSHEWLIDPGLLIPVEATAVHGITTERARAEGVSPVRGIREIAEELQAASQFPLVIYNAPFDLTLLDREVRRYEAGVVGDVGGPGGIWWDPTPVIDPLIIDKGIDTYRRGKRTLTATAEHYGIPFEGTAHGALADSITAGRLAQKLLDHPGLTRAVGSRSLPLLHDLQTRWADEQAEHYRDYLRGPRGNDPQKAETVDGTWPIRWPADTPAVLG